MVEAIVSRSNARFKLWKKQIKQNHDSFLLAGEDLLEETIDVFIPKLLFSSEIKLLNKWINNYSIKSLFPEPHLLSQNLLEKISGLKTFKGVCAIGSCKPYSMPVSGRFLFLDTIQDPGNFGMIIRSCLAFGWNGIFYTPNSCYPYHPKVIRASRGGIFELPIKKTTIKSFLEKTPTDQIWVTDKKGSLSPPSSLASSSIFLVIGNEGKGVSPEWPSTFNKVWIPTEKESLNVACAATLLLYSFR
ncbi:TrmH family RNA methyltransferase [Candidatus Similichlamydia epinepheli]|uniref:TrmH family RNA methyltransferase n=1 Tax=Candidatus Similichlamydia epinepheli TaxID=1903953 RepID=UPI000D3DBAD9|nr:RNA methyltransferase [Candidatus Similichlamydia epinepheli]